MDDREYILYQIKRMTKQLGRTPTQDEFCDRIERTQVIKHFKTYYNLLDAANIPRRQRKPK